MAMKQRIDITAKDKTKAAASSVKRSLGKVESAVKSVGVQMGVAFAVGAILRTNAAFEKMAASLRTVTGSAQGAERAMRDIRGYATELPSTVADLTNAFIKLKALGLEPTENAIKSYSNTASAMGKDLTQMIEAVADATTGEFERLKEFGIKAKSEGDRVSLTFQGVTTQIGKNAGEIQDYLLAIGNTQFAGAAAEQMDTLGGATSNLGVAVDNLSLAIGEAGLTAAATGAVNALSMLANEMAADLDIVREWAEAETAGKISWFEWLTTGSDSASESLKRLKLEAESIAPLLKGVIIQPGQLEKEFKGEGGVTEEDKIARQQELNAALAVGEATANGLAYTERQTALDALWALDLEQFARESSLQDKRDKEEQNKIKKNTSGLIAMAQAGNASMTELARNAAIEKAKIYAKEAIIGAYNWGTGVGGPIMGAAAAATASVAVGSLISALKGGGEGASAPAANISSIPSSDTPIPVVGQEEQKGAITIEVHGNIYGDAVDAIAEELKDKIDNNDVVLFSKDSRQAQELTT